MSNKTFSISLISLLITTAVVAIISQRGIPSVVTTNLENLPMEINNFKAVEDSFSQAIYDELNADMHIYRHYRSNNGKVS